MLNRTEYNIPVTEDFLSIITFSEGIFTFQLISKNRFDIKIDVVFSFNGRRTNIEIIMIFVDITDLLTSEIYNFYRLDTFYLHRKETAKLKMYSMKMIKFLTETGAKEKLRIENLNAACSTIKVKKHPTPLQEKTVTSINNVPNTVESKDTTPAQGVNINIGTSGAVISTPKSINADKSKSDTNMLSTKAVNEQNPISCTTNSSEKVSHPEDLISDTTTLSTSSKSQDVKPINIFSSNQIRNTNNRKPQANAMIIGFTLTGFVILITLILSINKSMKHYNFKKMCRLQQKEIQKEVKRPIAYVMIT
ncbi:hypothetical protein RF11_07706 [Thelohanellus kitauei]|uniref:Uncharacterized protein n=1 Tax=Thelohanellus kitauei TaxID=669202 RepID=A0A0C2JDL7_THEKT|nr:hypothetical protein RF11_07706 [Thelohanellus kitauei]